MPGQRNCLPVVDNLKHQTEFGNRYNCQQVSLLLFSEGLVHTSSTMVTEPKAPPLTEFPRWLTQAEVAAQTIQSGRDKGLTEAEIFKIIFEATGLAMASAKRFIRLRQFLIIDYPSLISKRPFRAGAYVVRELQQLHLANPEAANAIAQGIIEGAFSVRSIRDIIANTKLSATSSGESSRVSAFRKTKDFAKHVVSAVTQDPSLLGLANVRMLEVPKHRTPLMPDLVIYHNDGRVTAIEIKQGVPESAVTINTAGTYLARLAQLEQRYNHAILVLPREAAAFAECIKDIQQTWAQSQPNILLFEDEAHPTKDTALLPK